MRTLRDIAETTLALLFGLCMALLILVPLPIIGWYDHTEWVQEWTQEGFDQMRRDSVRWALVEPTVDPDQLRRNARDSLIATVYVPRNGVFDTELDVYKDSLYKLISIIVNTPDDQDAIFAALQNITMAQIELEWANQDFQDSTFRAMRHTFW